jgi:hypothetical protein
MNAHRIKAICNSIASSFGRGGHEVAAEYAGISPGVWSNYCNLDRPDCTIPMHRAVALEDNTGRRDFSRAFAERVTDAPAGSGDARMLGSLALETIARAEVLMAQAFADNVITEHEKRELVATGQQLVERAQHFLAAITDLPTGAQTARGPLRSV